MSIDVISEPRLSRQLFSNTTFSMDSFATPAAALASEVLPDGGSNSQVLRKTRSSCDRCHAQKLRCTREKGTDICHRCLRLQIPCRFSPRNTRSSIASHQQPSKLSHGNWNEQLFVSEPTHLPVSRSISMFNDSIWLLPPNKAADVGEGQEQGQWHHYKSNK